MKKLIQLMAFLTLFFAMLQLNAVAQKVVAKPAAATKVKNNIKLKSNGFKVKEAYLLFDDGTAVPEDNKVEINQRINLVLIIDGGWKVVDGLVYPGASEKISLSNGSVVLNEPDLFTAYDATGVSPKDAGYITLKAVITQIDNKKLYIIVNFKVWDKKSMSTITGSYKFFIK